MTSFRVTLESFESDASQVSEGPDYERGLADGLKHAASSQDALLARSMEEISSCLTDMAFGYEEARIHLLERLRPLLTQLAEAVLPQVAQESFGAHLIEVIESEFRSASDAPIRVAVSENLSKPLEAALPGDHFVFSGDPTLTAGQAIICQDDSQLLLDLPALVFALQSALNGLEYPIRMQSNG